jgi:hypothetical protein
MTPHVSNWQPAQPPDNTVKVIDIDRSLLVKVGNKTWNKWVYYSWFIDKFGIPEIGMKLKIEK